MEQDRPSEPSLRCETCARELAPRAICETTEALSGLFRLTGEDAPDGCFPVLPDARSVVEALSYLRQCMFPSRWLSDATDCDMLAMFLQERLSASYPHLLEAIKNALPFRWNSEYARVSGKGTAVEDVDGEARRVLAEFLGRLPAIRELLIQDVRAAYRGDPAAHSFAEVVVSYPCIAAITTHRIAHELYRLDVPIVPRIMSEVAHAETGIDIHPGAQIGASFFVDHGTGVVIGETSHVGNNVKLYQGVTLGAKSFPVDENGIPVKDIKRHPTIEDNVTIYAGATILGGDTVIGEGSVIGANVFVSESVPPGSTVTQKHPELRVR